MATLESYVNQKVLVLTNDGRLIVGTLKGFDQNVNVILDQCEERVFSLGSSVEKVPLGLYIVRGDNIAVVGEVDEEDDAALDFDQLHAAPINPVVH